MRIWWGVGVVFGGVLGGELGVVLSNTPPRSNPDKHWPRSKFGGVLGEKEKFLELCET